MAPILNLRAISVSDLLSTTTKTATDLVSDTVNMLENLPLTRKDSGSGDPNNSQTPDQSGSSGNITTVIIICIIGTHPRCLAVTPFSSFIVPSE